jgi:tRNA (guanine-N7-)-methyltransferase
MTMKINPVDNAKNTFRCHPENWLWPQPVQDWFAHPHSDEPHLVEPLPVEVDIGSGLGRFLLGRALANPEINFLGIERQLKRIRRMDRKAVRRGLHNVRLFRMEGAYAVRHLIARQSVSTYYLFFPDPWPKDRHAMHRILQPAFVDALHQTLIDGGVFHFATDHLPYFYEVRDILIRDDRFEETAPYIPMPDERTDFELKFLHQKPIGRLSVKKR